MSGNIVDQIEVYEQSDATQENAARRIWPEDNLKLRKPDKDEEAR